MYPEFDYVPMYPEFDYSSRSSSVNVILDWEKFPFP